MMGLLAAIGGTLILIALFVGLGAIITLIANGMTKR